MEQTMQAIDRCAKWLMPFAAWRMPESERISFCAVPSLTTSRGQSGFFISEFAQPFAQACWIPFEIGAEEALAMDMPNRFLPALSSESTDKDEYMASLSALVAKLKSRGNSKTVISTVKTVEAPNINVAQMAKQLFANGKGLFCSCWYHPRLGMWIGATPELLLSVHDSRLRSIALAGTTPAGQPWDSKNKAEHQFVVDYIAEALAMHGATPKISSTYDVGFGEIKHLRTDFEASLPPRADVGCIIDAINPTPALCGYPKAQSLSDISAIERHSRSCYGGLVGVASDRSIDAYVNIRCVQIGTSQLRFYSGGGITADSDPAAEWTEAQAKRQQLINFLNLS